MNERLISVVEIPVVDFSRASRFYETILGVSIETVEMPGMTLGVFSGSGSSVAVQLVKGEGYQPSADGAIVYLNGGADLQRIADKLVASGGKILIPKTEIGPELGFYAIFQDTEGNKLGLHSYR